MNKITPEEAKQIAEEAYIYAFPMLMGYRFAYATFLQPASPGYRGPVNAGPFGEAVTLDHTFKDVITPNADTPYSLGMLDLRGGPMVLTVPEVTDRYYVTPFVDLFGCNALIIGSRATGSAAGSYFLMGPTWEGEVPEGFSDSFRFETDVVFLLGRTQLLSPDDQPALAEVMRQYRLEPYEVYRGGAAPALPPFDWPVWDDGASRDERFIGYLNFLLSFCQPTHPSEADLMARIAKIGIGAGLAFDADALNDEVRETIRAGVAAARETMAAKTRTLTQKVNGWMSSDVFGTREWYGGDYLLRAVAAMAGWGGNDVIEAMYPTASEDAGGDPLDGAHRYQITFTTPPPAKAFWSVTMYDTSYDGTAGYLVENPINRYLINSTTEGLVFGDDGALTITMQRDEPDDPTERANWLPTPDGEFYLVLRMYWPKPGALDGTWEPPLVVRVD